MKRAGKVIECLLPLLVAIVCQYVVVVIASFVYGVILRFQVQSLGITDEIEQKAYFLEKSTSPDLLMVITALATLVTLVVGAVWYERYKTGTEYNLKTVMNKKLVLSLLCLGLSLQILISMCLSAIYPLLPQKISDQYNNLMETLIGGNVWLSLFVTVILAPLAEELLFRGITLKKAQKLMPFMWANVLQALLFGVYHGNLIQGVYAFGFGMVFGFTAEYFHSIWASILLHAFVNASAEVLNHLPESIMGTLTGVAGIVIIGIVLLFAAARLFPKARKEVTQKFTKNSFDEL